ncbi:hypothetical protein E2I20_27920 [Alcaligenaceae bacterium SAGV3]|nr:hypothetical protein [Alcaligenaceae bacterium SAGV3]
MKTTALLQTTAERAARGTRKWPGHAAAAVLGAALLGGCAVVPAPGYDYGYGDVVTATVAPPVPYVEAVPVAPFTGAIWVGGYWDWVGSRHVWYPGHYEHPRPGMFYRQPGWTHGSQASGPRLSSTQDPLPRRLRRAGARLLDQLAEDWTTRPDRRYLMSALAISLFAHLILFALHFTAPGPTRPERDDGLEVVLLNAGTGHAPAQAQLRAQVASDGGGDAASGHAKAPVPHSAASRDGKLLAELQQRQAALEAEQRRLAASLSRAPGQAPTPPGRIGRAEVPQQQYAGEPVGRGQRRRGIVEHRRRGRPGGQRRRRQRRHRGGDQYPGRPVQRRVRAVGRRGRRQWRLQQLERDGWQQLGLCQPGRLRFGGGRRRHGCGREQWQHRHGRHSGAGRVRAVDRRGWGHGRRGQQHGRCRRQGRRVLRAGRQRRTLDHNENGIPHALKKLL